MDLKKIQKQGRDERTQEDYPTSAQNTQQMSGSLLAFFQFCLVSVPFSKSLLKIKFSRNYSAGGLNHFQMELFSK